MRQAVTWQEQRNRLKYLVILIALKQLTSMLLL